MCACRRLTQGELPPRWPPLPFLHATRAHSRPGSSCQVAGVRRTCMPPDQRLRCWRHSEFASYVADCAKSNLSCQILPGLLPIRDHEEFRRICRALHLTPPTWLLQRLSSGDGASVVGDQVFRRLVARAHHRCLSRHEDCLGRCLSLHLPLLTAATFAPPTALSRT